MRDAHTHSGCSADCRYRSLYEGTQASLTDMAAKQSDALGRIGRLRSAVINAMKTTKPRKFAEVEEANRLRVQDGDDQFLVAVLEHLLRDNTATDPLRTLSEVRAELARLGIHLTGDDPRSWVQQLRSTPVRSEGTTAKPVSPGLATTTSFADAVRVRQSATGPSPWEKVAHSGSELLRGVLPGAPVAHAPVAAGPSVAQAPARAADLPEPLKLHEPEQPVRSTETVSSAARNDASLQEPTVAAEPVAPAAVAALAGSTDQVKEQVKEQDAEQAVEEDIFAVEDDEMFSDAADDFGGLPAGADSDPFGDDPFDDEPEMDGPEPTQEHVDESELLTTDDANDSPGSPVVLSDDVGEKAIEDAIDTADTAREAERAVAGPVERGSSSGDLTALFDDLPPKENEHVTAPAPVTGAWKTLDGTIIEASPTVAIQQPRPSDATPAVATPQVAAQPEVSATTQGASGVKQRRKVASAPVRVELFPHTTPQRPSGTRRRKPRTSALPPEAFALEGLVDDAGLTDEVRNKLLAVVCTPQPVFCGDLVSVGGDVETVELWQDEARAKGTVRFINAKARHRQLGSLALPGGELRKQATEFTRSWWAAAMDRYVGAKLYELGVVGRRTAGRVKGWHVDEVHPVVSLRVSDDKGLSGILVVCDDELGEGSLARRGVVAEIESLMREPLEVIYVLATGDKTLDPLVECVVEEAKRRSWQAPCTVVCARSWEWADGTGPLIQVL